MRGNSQFSNELISGGISLNRLDVNGGMFARDKSDSVFAKCKCLRKLMLLSGHGGMAQEELKGG